MSHVNFISASIRSERNVYAHLRHYNACHRDCGIGNRGGIVRRIIPQEKQSEEEEETRRCAVHGTSKKTQDSSEKDSFEKETKEEKAAQPDPAAQPDHPTQPDPAAAQPDPTAKTIAASTRWHNRRHAEKSMRGGGFDIHRSENVCVQDSPS